MSENLRWSRLVRKPRRNPRNPRNTRSRESHEIHEIRAISTANQSVVSKARHFLIPSADRKIQLAREFTILNALSGDKPPTRRVRNAAVLRNVSESRVQKNFI